MQKNFAEEKPDEIKFTQESSVVIQSIINEFSSRFKQFRRFENTSKFILYPDTLSADDLNLEIFEWLNLVDIEMKFINFQSSSRWKQKLVDLRTALEIIESN